MGVETARTRRRWALVTGAIGGLCALPVVIGAWPVSAQVPDPEALRTAILTADTPYRGYAESTGALGLPDLPETGDVAALLGGRTELRVWWAGPRSSRVDVLTATGERGFYTTPGGSTAWDYERNVSTDLVGEPDLRLPRAADLTPPDLARRLLGGPRGAETVTALPARRIAGATAPGLRLVPRDPDTTIGAVEVWAHPGTGVALEVAVTGRGAGAPGVRTRFLDFVAGPDAVPAATVTPPYPEGADYALAQVPRISAFVDRSVPVELPSRLAGRASSDLLLGGGSAVRAYGEGFSLFTTVAVVPGLGFRAFDAARTAGAEQVDLPGGDAVVLRTELLTLLVALPDFGPAAYLLAGPVQPAVLRAAAAELVEGS